MRFFKLTFAAVLVASALAVPAAAQRSATLVGGGRAEVRIAASARIPEFVRMRVVAGPQATWQGERFTEYLLSYEVTANTAWEVEVGNVPAGLTVLTETGDWMAQGEAIRTTVAAGQRTGWQEVRVRVRVADGSSVTWAEELQVQARSIGGF